MNLTPVLRHRYFNSNGSPLAGGKLYTYQAGTTTPQATYTDSGGLTPNTNPVILDANGEAAVWVDPSLSYKYVLKDSSDVTQWTVDNVIGLLTANSVATASLQDLSVTTAKIANKAVDSTKLASDASVDGNRAVTTDHIRDAAIKSAKLAADVIDAMTAVTSVASGDELLVYSAANSANRKVTVDNFKKTPTIQRFTTGSGTYTTASGARWIRITLSGGGGGGGGGAGTGGAGGTTTFGSSLLTATGGGGGDLGATAGGAGGSVTVNSPAVALVASAGSYGSGGPATGTTFQPGSPGGSNALGGAGAGAQAGGGGQPAIANTGGGGGGGGNGSGGSGCGGGGAGGYIQAMIISPSASYAYTVGAGGSGVASSGTVGTGGGGGSGVIIVEEFY